MKNNSKPCIVTTTTDSENTAKTIAQKLVAEKLAACVQVDKVRSFYIWEEKPQESEEFRLNAKTVERNYDDIVTLILANHNYDLPEIIKTDITGGLDDYLDWIDSCCTK
jgi:periplasmic divalent cation tolerance protein